MDQQCLRAQLHPPSSPTYDSHRLHLPNSTDGSCTLTQLRLSNDKAIECARHRPLESRIGPKTLHYKSTPTPTEVDPVYVERTDDFEIASAGTQCR
ncbi:hypothetical protein THAOC_07497, partial [Thalassiosira oceanica]